MIDLDELITKQTILVIDSDPHSGKILTEILSPYYNVKVALTAACAFKWATALDKPDLILLDTLMPDIDGYRICKYFKQVPATSEIPVIFISGSDVDEKIGFDSGGVDYLAKPLKPTLVLARVNTHLKLASQKTHLLSLVKERTQELELTRMEILESLSRAGDYKDNASSLHVLRISHYARVLAKRVTGNQSWSELLFNAAPIHDIGKVGIPDHVLLKTSKLNASEQAILEKHVDYGLEILGDNQSDLLTMAVEIVHFHHEKWDGSGYPERLKGEDIPLSARIVAIADVFDGLTSGRPYKQATSIEQAMAFLARESGKHFDPDLVTHFAACLPQIIKIKEQFADQPG